MDSEHDAANVSDEIKRKVRDWLLEDGFSIEEKTKPGLAWGFVVKAAEGVFSVTQRAKQPTAVYIARGIDFGQDIQAVIARMELKKRNEFYNRVRFMLLTIGVEFKTEGKTLWEKVFFSERIYYDGLTHDRFMRSLFSIQRAVVGLDLMINEISPDAPPDQNEGSSLGAMIN